VFSRASGDCIDSLPARQRRPGIDFQGRCGLRARGLAQFGGATGMNIGPLPP
jgi:hypothetical protein